MADPVPSLRKLLRLLCCLTAALVLVGCGQESNKTDASQNNSALATDSLSSSVNYRAIEIRLARMTNDYAVRLSELTSELDSAVTRFLESPSEESRLEFQSAWLAAHNEFSAALPLVRIRGLSEALFEIDAWPMEPGFLDSLPDYPESGIINDATLAITDKTLEDQHGITDPSEVSLGFHPLEYYAFTRPLEDFILTTNDATEPTTIHRRREVLSSISAHLVRSINALAARLKQPEAREKEGISAARFVYAVVSAGRRTAQDNFREASLIVDGDQGHCEFSESSRLSLERETSTLRSIFAKDSGLMKALSEHSASTANNLNITLDQAVAVLAKDEVIEEDRARLPLMLLAISHQLEEYELAYKGAGN